MTPEGKAGHRHDRLPPQIAAFVGAKAHHERNEGADPRPGRHEMDGVVGAMQDPFGAGLHRRMADEAEARQKRRRGEGRGRPFAARAEDDDSDERRRQAKMRRHAWPKAVSVRTELIAPGSRAALQSSAIEAEFSASHTIAVRSATTLATSAKRRIAGDKAAMSRLGA